MRLPLHGRVFLVLPGPVWFRCCSVVESRGALSHQGLCGAASCPPILPEAPPSLQHYSCCKWRQNLVGSLLHGIECSRRLYPFPSGKQTFPGSPTSRALPVDCPRPPSPEGSSGSEAPERWSGQSATLSPCSLVRLECGAQTHGPGEEPPLDSVGMSKAAPISSSPAFHI